MYYIYIIKKNPKFICKWVYYKGGAKASYKGNWSKDYNCLFKV